MYLIMLMISNGSMLPECTAHSSMHALSPTCNISNRQPLKHMHNLKYMQHLKSRVHGALQHACIISNMHNLKHATSQTCTISNICTISNLQHLKHATTQTYAQSQRYAASQTRNMTNTQHNAETPGTLAPPSQDSKQPWYHS